jgi:hypothetical protein
LLELLRLSDWDVVETVAFAGGHLVLARDDFGNDVRVERETFAEASLVVFTECVRRRRLRHQQIPLFGRAA